MSDADLAPRHTEQVEIYVCTWTDVTDQPTDRRIVAWRQGLTGVERMDSVSWLDSLLQDGRIRLRRGALLDTTPPVIAPSRDRIEGMLLGLAVGDSLGNTSEGLTPDQRADLFGEIREYQPHRHAGGRAVGLPSDDTQMAFWTLAQLLEDGGYVPENVARSFTKRQIFGIGATVRQFLVRFHFNGLPWYEAGTQSAGNGALMRIAPMLLPHLGKPSPALWADTALSAMTTHNDAAAITSAVGFVGILWDLLGMETAPTQEWWVERYVSLVSDLEIDTLYTPRGGAFVGWEGKLSAFVAEHVPAAAARDLSAREACDEWYSAAFLLETVPSVLYILSRHASDPEEAIVRAVNDTRDNDTVGAIVGAAVGALHGASALPARWRNGLLGRTGFDDDGRVFELIDRAMNLFVPGVAA